MHRCALSALFAALLAMLPVGAASAQPRPIGRMVDVGDHKLHLLCAGKGGPAVILESGAGEFSFDWALVQPLIAKDARVCAVDRAGYAWSEMSAGFEQFEAAAVDLRGLLQKAGVKPPYVLVGHAQGALYARDYQRRFPQEVAGLVLVDPVPEEDFQVQMFGKTVSLIDMADHDLRAWPLRPFAPSHTSPPPRRRSKEDGVGAPFDKLPAVLQADREWALGRLFDELDGLSDAQALVEMESQRATLALLYNSRHNPATSPLTIPIFLLGRGRDTTPEIAAMQGELSRLSRDELHVTVAESGTQIQIERPQVVASAVMDTVRAIRAGKPLNTAAAYGVKP